MRNRAGFKQYIKEMLGEPLISVELTDTQMNENIQLAIDKFSEFAVEGREKATLIVEIPQRIDGVCELLLDESIMEVTSLSTSTGGSLIAMPGGLVVANQELIAMLVGKSDVMGGVDMLSVVSVLAKVSALEYLFSVKPNIDFNGITKKLKIFQDMPQGTKILMEVCLKPIIKDDTTPNPYFEQQWIKKYSIALCKKQWGSNIGKFEGVLVNGTRVNYERLIQEANDEIEKLENELVEAWFEPLPIIRG